MSTLVLVDGPNLFNDVERALDAGGVALNVRRDYMREWFDIDRIVHATIGATALPTYQIDGLGVVVFHSDKYVGRSGVRIQPQDADAFWGRQATAPGMSTVLVTVPGHQPERTHKCPECTKDIVVTDKAEKGIDTSMVTYLYEAMEQWSQAVLFTNDADFVPPILALRRRGKKVFVAAIDVAGAGALKRACQTFHAIPWDMLQADVDTFRMLLPGGPLDTALAGHAANFGPINQLTITQNGGMILVLAQGVNASMENMFADALGDRSLVKWQTEQRGRVGQIRFPQRSAHLGFGALRHRGQAIFSGATWQAIWKDSFA